MSAGRPTCSPHPQQLAVGGHLHIQGQLVPQQLLVVTQRWARSSTSISLSTLSASLPFCSAPRMASCRAVLCQGQQQTVSGAWETRHLPAPAYIPLSSTPIAFTHCGKCENTEKLKRISLTPLNAYHCQVGAHLFLEVGGLCLKCLHSALQFVDLSYFL